MKTEDIKVGWIYNVRLKCITREIGESFPEFSFVAVDSQGEATCDDLVYFTEDDLPAFSYPSPPVTTPPAHDPCRKFRKGDKVRVVEWKGRNYTDRDHNTELHTGCFAEIWEDEKDEQEEGYVSVIYQEYIRYVPPCYLELVTPVEEMSPYSVRHSEVHAAYSIYGPYGLSAVNYFYGDRYPYSKHSAEAAAYAECDRLNAAHRKEKNNE